LSRLLRAYRLREIFQKLGISPRAELILHGVGA